MEVEQASHPRPPLLYLPEIPVGWKSSGGLEAWIPRRGEETFPGQQKPCFIGIAAASWVPALLLRSSRHSSGRRNPGSPPVSFRIQPLLGHRLHPQE